MEPVSIRDDVSNFILILFYFIFKNLLILFLSLEIEVKQIFFKNQNQNKIYLKLTFFVETKKIRNTELQIVANQLILKW